MNTRETIARALYAAGGTVSGAALSKQCAISRAAVWKHIVALKAEGYEIESLPGNGYRLVRLPALCALSIEAKLHNKPRPLYIYEELDSTNLRAKELARAGAPDGTLVLAKKQLAGRGRFSRTWESDVGGLYLSLLLRPACEAALAPRYSVLAALAVRDALAELGVQGRIKWPNDVLVCGKKVCGILTEFSGTVEAVEFLTVGIGVNANLGAFSPPLDKTATSLLCQLGHEVELGALAAAIANQMDIRMQQLAGEGFQAVLEDYKRHSDTLGKIVTVCGAASEVTGCAVDFDELGMLLLQTDAGLFRAVSGDVTVKKE